MGVLPAFIYAQQVCAWYPGRPEERVRIPGTGATGGSGPSCVCWQPNSDPLEEHSVRFITELFLQILLALLSYLNGLKWCLNIH